MKIMLWYAILVLVAIVPTVKAEQPVDALKGPIDKVVQILEDPQYEDPARHAEQREKIRSLTSAMFDFELIAKRATGRYHWENSFTAQQRQEFTDLFAEFLGNNYLSRISDDLKGLKVEYLDQDIDAVRKVIKKVGQELLGLIRQEDRYEATIEPLLSVLPSFTQLGMAALLPHETLGLGKDGGASVDGASVQGLDARRNILSQALGGKGTAIRADDLRHRRDRPVVDEASAALTDRQLRARLLAVAGEAPERRRPANAAAR